MRAMSDLDSQVRRASGINMLLGILLCAAPWVYGDTSAYRTLTINSMATGAAALVCGALRTHWPHRALSLSVINVALGLWTLIAPAAFDLSLGRAHLWTNISIGVALVVFGTWSISAKLSGDRTAR
jgi:hypothetical protein